MQCWLLAVSQPAASAPVLRALRRTSGDGKNLILTRRPADGLCAPYGDWVRLPALTRRTLVALHVAWGLPAACLALYFGVLDTPGFGEGRCSSCGVEGYVIGAHLAGAVIAAAVVIVASALRRRLHTSVAAPGRVAVWILAGAGLYVTVSLIWHDAFTPLAFAALLGSFVLFPVAGFWWVVGMIELAARPPRTDEQVARWAGLALTGAWVSLLVLVPAVYAWTWTDRVQWLVF